MSVRLLCDTARVLAEARHVEPDRARRRAWFVDDPIAAFGFRTAERVVASGETSRLIALLRTIRAHEKGYGELAAAPNRPPSPALDGCPRCVARRKTVPF